MLKTSLNNLRDREGEREERKQRERERNILLRFEAGVMKAK